MFHFVWVRGVKGSFMCVAFVFISFHYQHQHYTLPLSQMPLSPFKIKVHGLQNILCHFSNFTNNSSIMSLIKFFLWKLNLILMKIKFHLNFKNRTFINGRKGICFLFFIFPRNQTVLEGWVKGQRQLASTLVSFGESLGFFVWLVHWLFVVVVLLWFCVFVFENLKQTKSMKNLHEGQR